MAVQYVDNEKLSEEVDAWARETRAAIKEGRRVKMPDSIGRAIILIANNAIRQQKYSVFSASWREEMVQEAICGVVRYLHSFDATVTTHRGKPNAFSFITRSIENVFSDVINKERRHLYFANKVGVAILHDNHELLDGDPNLKVNVSEVINDMADRAALYEQKQDQKRRIARERSVTRKQNKELQVDENIDPEDITEKKVGRSKTNALF